ncbi:unnamed protein product, partial [Ectocarpus sp. 8 AP-2014]
PGAARSPERGPGQPPSLPGHQIGRGPRPPPAPQPGRRRPPTGERPLQNPRVLPRRPAGARDRVSGGGAAGAGEVEQVPRRAGGRRAGKSQPPCVRRRPGCLDT